MEKFEIICMIGEGSFGRVYKARNLYNNTLVAFKVILKRGRSDKELGALRQECEILQHLKHPNIILMLDSFETDSAIIVVTEFAAKELFQILGSEGYLAESQVKRIACELVAALHYLHSNRVLHRDLKPQNILIEADGTAKLCDFGFARSMSAGTHVLTSIKGTPLYMAPELIEEKPYDHNADLWSLGCIIYELIVGAPPFCTTSLLHLVHLIRHEAVKWPDFVSIDCINFMQGLLQKNPNKRLTWPALLHHPFVKDGILIKSNGGKGVPLTDPLTVSQAIAKENQKRDLETRTTGQSRALTQVVQKMGEEKGRSYSQHSAAINLNATACSSTSILGRDQMCINKNTGAIKKSYINQNMMPTKKDEAMYSELIPLPTSGTEIPEVTVKDTDSLQFIEDMQYGINVDELTDFLQAVHFSDVEMTESASNIIVSQELPQIPTTFESTSNIIVSQELPQIPTNLMLNKQICGLTDILCPIENDEWLAFLQQSMVEVMDGDISSLLIEKFVGMIILPLRNPKASCRVMEYVVSLLSLPLVNDSASPEEIYLLTEVYLEVKVVPNLVYASKLLVRQKDSVDCDSLRPVSDLTADELQALEVIHVLQCNLMHSREDFIKQFCDCMVVMKAASLFQLFFQLTTRKIRVVTDCLAIFCEVLRVCPESSSIVAHIVLGQNSSGEMMVDLEILLTHKNPYIRTHVCWLIHYLGQYGSSALPQYWAVKLINRLTMTKHYDPDRNVRRAATSALMGVENPHNDGN